MYKIFGGSVVAVAFQITFYLEIYQNNIFFIFKKLFLISTHQNDLKTQNIYQFEAKKKIKKLIFLKALLKRKNKQSFTKLN
jgi:hypothetical protein